MHVLVTVDRPSPVASLESSNLVFRLYRVLSVVAAIAVFLGRVLDSFPVAFSRMFCLDLLPFDQPESAMFQFPPGTSRRLQWESWPRRGYVLTGKISVLCLIFAIQLVSGGWKQRWQAQLIGPHFASLGPVLSSKLTPPNTICSDSLVVGWLNIFQNSLLIPNKWSVQRRISEAEVTWFVLETS